MHTKGRFRNVLFDSSLHPGSAALAILVMLLFLIFLLLFMTFAAQPVQGQSSARAQNPVPPTARQAAAMPEFASRLARHVPPEAAGKRRASAPACSGQASPQDNGVIYENGPVNGTTDAWTINFGYVVSDSFTVSGNSTVGGFDLYTWEFPGDVMTSVDWSITSAENGGTVYGSGTAPVTDQFISTNQFGYDIDKISVTGLNVGTGSGTVWLNLQNASVPSGDPIYWDENSGIGCKSPGCPSGASESAVGTIPSEAFDVVGGGSDTFPCFGGGVKVIHDFGGYKDSADPSGVTIDKAGNLYGATYPQVGSSSVYKLAQTGSGWVLNYLYKFLGGDKGTYASVIVGPNGLVYGSADGGLQNCNGKDCGFVFDLRPWPYACLTSTCGWMEDVLYQFTGLNDAYGGGFLVSDPVGNLYGTSEYGGAQGKGAVFELTPSGGGWTETILYSFTGGSDGANPWGYLLLGNDGNWYGNFYGGVFQLAPSASGWTENVIYQGLSTIYVQDSSGNLYGLDYTGQDVFMLSPSNGQWVYTLVADAPACWYPWDECYRGFFNLTVDKAHNLYTTGYFREWHCDCVGCKLIGGENYVEKLVPQPDGTWQGYLLVDYRDQEFPAGGAMAVDAHGNLYGTTSYCGRYGGGTVWQLSP